MRVLVRIQQCVNNIYVGISSMSYQHMLVNPFPPPKKRTADSRILTFYTIYIVEFLTFNIVCGCLLSLEYSSACVVLCRCLTNLLLIEDMINTPNT